MIVTMQMGPFTARTETTGELAMPASKNFAVGVGGVIRFSGKVPIRPDYVVNGDKDDPISFYIKKGIGPVYLRGKGSIEENGSVVASFPSQP